MTNTREVIVPDIDYQANVKEYKMYLVKMD